MDRKYIISAAAIALGVSAASSQEIATWAGFRTAAASFTFDDGAPSQVTDAAPMFDKYGYKGTFNLVTGWNPNWSGFQGMADTGHEIASHSDTHGQNMSGEEASSKKTIEGKIKQKYGIVTVAYPNCNVPNASAVKQNYVVGRICNGSWQSVPDIMDKNGPSDWTKVPALMTGSTGINTTDGYTGQMNSAISKGGWVAFLTHGFEGKNNGNATYSPTSLSAMEGALQWAKQNDSKIWVAPMGFVGMYIKERNAAKIEAISGAAAGTLSYKLTHNIADNISKYDYPLSIRVKNANSWTTVSASQDGKAIDASIKDGYIYFDAVPNGGDIVLSSTGSTIVPGSSSSVSDTPASSSSVTSTPFKGAIAIPGTIEAENYDVNAYVHASSENEAPDYRTDNAGVVKAGTGYAVGYTTAGDYFEYTLDVKVAGKYKVSVNGATGNASAGFVTVAVGSNSTEVAIKAQGDWDTYSESEGEEIQLAAGKQILRLTINNDNLNVDWIKLTGDASVVPSDPGPAAISDVIRLDVNSGMVQCQVFDMNGQLVKSAKVASGSVRELWNHAGEGLSAGMYVMRYGQGKSLQSIRVRK